MELQVHGKQMDLGTALRSYVEDKADDINEKYDVRTTHFTVTFSPEGHSQPRTRAHISIQLGGNMVVVADATEKDAYVAFDTASEKAAKQIRRYKRKIRDHHAREETAQGVEALNATQYILSAAPEQDDEAEVPENFEPAVIAEMSNAVMTLGVADAVMHMDLAGEQAFVFRNAKNGAINVVYRRSDGNIGWIDPDNHK